ncbi:MAG: beta-galactosidase [Chloroflexi bacterium]|nr:beta-galactosidase [Chloroflexota bacterium]
MNTVTHMQHPTHQRQQLRGFMAVWMAVTLLVGVATFVAIYVGTDNLGDNNNGSNNNTNSSVAAVVDNQSKQEAAPVDQTTTNNDTVQPETVQDTSANGEAPVSSSNGDAAQASDGSASNPAVESAANGGTENNPPAQPAQQDASPTPSPTFAPTLPATQQTGFDLGAQVMIPYSKDANSMTGTLDAVSNQLRLNWVKLQVRWQFVEPEEGVYDWSYLDAFFQSVTEKNLKVLVGVVTAPEWARQAGADLTKNGPPADNQKFADFIAQLITRYPSKIHAIEVWNEMNIDREWASINGINAPEYVEMLRAVANTIRFLDPNIMVVSGALSPTGVNNDAVHDDFRYTDELIAAGVLDVIDCFGAHHNGYNIGPNVPYDQVPNDPTATFRGPFDSPHPSWSFYSTLTTYANKISAAGSTVPLCVTEFGWATTADLGGQYPQYFEFANDNTLDESAQFIVEAIQLMEEWGFVRLAFIWNLNFGPEEGFNATNDNVPYSLIRPNYYLSPAWGQIAEMDFRGRAEAAVTGQ